MLLPSSQIYNVADGSELLLEVYKQQTNFVQLDFDGVVSQGIPWDPKFSYVCTGRCFDECSVLYKFFNKSTSPFPAVYFNSITKKMRGEAREPARAITAHHKASVAATMLTYGVELKYIVDDDSMQLEQIKLRLVQEKLLTDDLKFILIKG